MRKMYSFAKSFSHAAGGIFRGIISGRNLRVHFVAALYCLLVAPFFLKTAAEWAVTVLLICTVISSELINTAIEFICDAIDSSYSKRIRIIKDLASGAVLLVAIAAVVIACLLFLRRDGFLHFIAFCKSDVWYPVLLVILTVPSFLFIDGKFVKNKKSR